MNINDLIGKKVDGQIETKSDGTKKTTIIPSANKTGEKKVSFNIGGKSKQQNADTSSTNSSILGLQFPKTEQSPLAKAMEASQNTKVASPIPQKNPIIPPKQSADIKSNESADSVFNSAGNLSDKNAGIVSMQNPTLADISKFVFEEQPDESTEEITEKFSAMLDHLANSVGTEIADNLSRTLQFIKEHPFLADILKPEFIGVLVTAMRRSYGFVVQVQDEKQAKRKKKDEKVSGILNDLDNLTFM